jgi:hypothetical protein
MKPDNKARRALTASTTQQRHAHPEREGLHDA